MADAGDMRPPRINSFQAFSRSLRNELAPASSTSAKALTASITARWHALSVEEKETWREKACALSGVDFVPKTQPSPPRPAMASSSARQTRSQPARPMVTVPSSSRRRDPDVPQTPLDMLAHTAEARRRKSLSGQIVLQPPQPTMRTDGPYAWAPVSPSWSYPSSSPPMILPPPSAFVVPPQPSPPIAPSVFRPSSNPSVSPEPDSPADRHYRAIRAWQLETLAYLRTAPPETQRQAALSPGFYVAPTASVTTVSQRQQLPPPRGSSSRSTLYDAVLDDA